MPRRQLTKDYFKITSWSGDALLKYGFTDDDALLTAAYSAWIAQRRPQRMYFSVTNHVYQATFLIMMINAGTDFAYAEICMTSATHRQTGVTEQVHRINTPPSGRRDLSVTPPMTRRGSRG